MLNTRLVLLLSLTSLAVSHSTWAGAYADTGVPLFPGGAIIDESEDQNLLNRLIVTGEVKRVRTKYEPESVLNVEGTMASITLRLEGQRRTEGVIRFYQSVFEKTAEVLFQCRGLDCGSSNYWANSLFQKALLYGPTKHQFYLVARIQTGDYHVVYVAQRGTGAVYVHLVRIQPEAIAPGAATNQSSDIATQMHLSGQYQLQNPLTSQEFASLMAYLTTESSAKFALVVHNAPSAGESVGAALARSRMTATTLQQRLAAEGLYDSKYESNISVYAIGPLAPDARGRRNRTELVRID